MIWFLLFLIIFLFGLISLIKSRLDSVKQHNERLNQEIEKLTIEINILKRDKAPIERVNSILESLSKKADAQQLSLVKNSIREIEQVVFQNETTDELIARTKRIDPNF